MITPHIQLMHDHILVVKAGAAEQKTAGGLILPGKVSDFRHYKVLAIGPGTADTDPAFTDAVAVGSTVLMRPGLPEAIRIDGEEYELAKFAHVVAVVPAAPAEYLVADWLDFTKACEAVLRLTGWTRAQCRDWLLSAPTISSEAWDTEALAAAGIALVEQPA